MNHAQNTNTNEPAPLAQTPTQPAQPQPAQPQTARKTHTTLDLAYIAIAAAIIAICSWISIPMAVPFTLQTFAVFAILLILGGRRGTLAVLTYILLGAIGLPVFSGFNGGIGVLLGNTGGYILGFILMGVIHIIITHFLGDRFLPQILSMTLGLLVCYTFGTAWFMFLYLRRTGTVALATVLSWCVIPFILPDILKMALAFVVARRVKPLIKDRPRT